MGLAHPAPAPKGMELMGSTNPLLIINQTNQSPEQREEKLPGHKILPGCHPGGKTNLQIGFVHLYKGQEGPRKGFEKKGMFFLFLSELS